MTIVLNLDIAGPIVATLAFVDVTLHVVLDLKKVRDRQASDLQQPDQSVPAGTIAAIAFSTFLAFILVFIISLAWLFPAIQFLFLLMIPLFDTPLLVWMIGLTILCLGILLHGWSRLARRNMASSWAMGPGHRLVQSGPYSRIRHPSYAAYMLSFVGLLLMLPSVITLVSLVGILGYYYVTGPEEELLISRFGDEYREYAARTGKFLPRVRKKQVKGPKP
jgi:protein-S-isoprenylcysteine O-methyltransferase Ste14